MRPRAAGLHLWTVTLVNAADEQLWITTATRDIREATQKTMTFLKLFRKVNGYPRAQVKTITNHGTIDA